MEIPDTLVSTESQPTLVQKLVRSLEVKLSDGTLKPGDSLPAERVLGEQLGVSRTVVRGATADLAARGLLEVLPGGGYRVRVPTVEHLSSSLTYILRGSQAGLSYAHIHAVRRVLEREIAQLAALSRTPGDLLELRRCLDIMAGESAPTEAYCMADVAFHRALAVASGNPLFVVLLDAIAEILIEVRRRGTALLDSIERGCSHHEAIFACVERGDGPGASAAMEAHLTDSEAIQRQIAELLK